MSEKYKIVSRLLNEDDPIAIAGELDVSVNKVRRLKRELSRAQQDNKVQEFMNIEDAMFDELMEIAKDRAPASIQDDVGGALTELKGVHSLMDALSQDMICTAKFLSGRIRVAAATTQHVSELEILSDALCSMQTAFFNSNTTQVNVQNVYGGAEQGSTYGDLLDDKPADI